MRRPGPLQELPLERFLPSNPNLPPVSPFKSVRPNKRPLSPGGPSLFSPAKRRILNEEGIFSPEKTLKSPMLESRGRAQSPAHFTDVLRGPGSPAKKLDFGLPKNHLEKSKTPAASMTLDVTPPRPRSTTSGLAPSPEFIPKSKSAQSSSFASSRHSDDTLEMDNYFSPQPRPSPSRPTVTPALIPRELPPPPDPQSVHYPGFRVHQDTHIIIAPVGSDFDIESVASAEKDGQKENIPLRGKARKAATAPTSSDLKTLLFSPNAKNREIEKMVKARSTPVTPKKVGGWERLGMATPTSRKPHTGLTPGLREGVKVRRMILEDEVDEVGSDEEGDESLL